MEQDPFAFWSKDFDSSGITQVSVAENVIDLAKTLEHEIVSAPFAKRKQLGEEATELLEKSFPMDFIQSKLAILADRALVIEELYIEEFLAKGEAIPGPLMTLGRLGGFRFIHHNDEQSNNPVPVFGLKLTNSKLLDIHEMPVGEFDRPLLIPVGEILESRVI